MPVGREGTDTEGVDKTSATPDTSDVCSAVDAFALVVESDERALITCAEAVLLSAPPDASADTRLCATDVAAASRTVGLPTAPDNAARRPADAVLAVSCDAASLPDALMARYVCSDAETVEMFAVEEKGRESGTRAHARPTAPPASVAVTLRSALVWLELAEGGNTDTAPSDVVAPMSVMPSAVSTSADFIAASVTHDCCDSAPLTGDGTRPAGHAVPREAADAAVDDAMLKE